MSRTAPEKTSRNGGHASPSRCRSGAAALSTVLTLGLVIQACSGTRGEDAEPKQTRSTAALTGGSDTTRPLSDVIGISAGGVPANVSDQIRLLNDLVAVGIHRIRVDFTWKVIEPAPGQWDFTRYDAFVANAAVLGVEILAILDYGVPWANKDLYPPAGEEHAPPDDLQAFVTFAKTVVTKYHASVRSYEVWNEPNNGGTNWKLPPPPPTQIPSPYGDAPRFAALAHQTIQAVHGLGLGVDIAPGGTIFLAEPAVGGVGNDSGTDFMKKAFAAEPGLASSSDATVLHAYTAYPPNLPPESDLLDFGFVTDVPLDQKVSDTATAWQAAGQAPGAPVWLTEVGWPTFHGCGVNAVDEAAQARWLVRSTLLGVSSGVDYLYLYNMYDSAVIVPPPFPGCDGTIAHAEQYFGIFHLDKTPKLSASALRLLLATVGGDHVTGIDKTLELSGTQTRTKYVVHMTGSGQPAWVLWNTSDVNGSTFTQTDAWTMPPNTSCVTIFGDPCPISNGILSVGPTPVYVVGQAPSPPVDATKGCNRAGDVIDAYQGIPGRSIKDYCDDSSGSGEYQCDQFANRFVSSLDLPPVDNWVTNLACEICSLVANDPKLSALYSVWGPGYGATAGQKPAPNDLLVWYESEGCNESNKAFPGHVAVVTGTTSNAIEYVQQNWIVAESVNGSAYASVSRSSTAWDDGTSFFGDAGGPFGGAFHAECWVHPKCPANTSCHPPGDTNPCRHVPHVNNGQYCGKSNQTLSGWNPAAADPDTVYECFDNQVANETKCPSGCFVAAAGQPDACNPPKDPCNTVAAVDDGIYCGRSPQNHFNKNGTAGPNSVYDCRNGRAVSVAFCSSGCYISPGIPATPDGCNNDPCARVGLADDGFYCGTSGQAHFGGATDSNTIYDCRNGHSVATAYCGTRLGCTPSGAAISDRCTDDPCSAVAPADNGLYCGHSRQAYFARGAADPTMIYDCLNGRTVWTESCAKGCYEARAGQSDGCL